MAIIEGTAYWASLTRPNERFEPMWRIDLAVDDTTASTFKTNGFAVGETKADDKVVNNISKYSNNNMVKNNLLDKITGDTKPALIEYLFKYEK